MKCLVDIKTYAKIRSEKKLFQFLNALDRKYKSIKREILRLEPLPSAEAAYATIRKKAAHQKILGATNHKTQGIASGLIANQMEGVELSAKGHRQFDGKRNGSSGKEDKTHLKCGNYGKTRHTKEQCFELVGYPDWWNDGYKRAQRILELKKEKLSLPNLGEWRTGAIIRRETERQVLYFVDEGETECTYSQDTLSWLSCATSTSEEERSQSPQDETPHPTQPEDVSATSETAPDLIPEIWREGGVLSKEISLWIKTVPKSMVQEVHLAMNNYRFNQSNSDHTLFRKWRGNLIIFLIIYVDEMIIIGDDKEEIAKLRKSLFIKFEMKSLGELKYFLGIKVLRSNQGIFMCQSKYILDLLTETGMVDCKPADTLMIMNQKLYMEEKAEPAKKERYQ
nr:putative ribonuclease H-like domain-containing protein [Tanacetum cinerariifolium]